MMLTFRRDSELLKPYLTTCTMLEKAWTRSASTLQALERSLAAVHDSAPHTLIAVAGSLGRMEQVDASDADLMVIAEPETKAVGNAPRPIVVPTASVIVQLQAALDAEQLPHSNPEGIFAREIAAAELVDPARRGRVAEELPIFGTRIQLLLDTQPLINAERLWHLQRRVLDWYDDASLGEPQSRWNYLTHDLLRYFHSLAVQVHWERETRSGSRRGTLKFHHSRRLSIATLIMLLGQSLQENEPVEWLAATLPFTPLERLAMLYQRYEDDHFSLVMQACDEILRQLGQPSRQDSCSANRPVGGECHSTNLSRIDQAVMVLADEMTRFARRHEILPPPLSRALLF